MFSLPAFTQTNVLSNDGINLTIDTSYQIGNSVDGVSKAKLTVKNNSNTLVTGFQFRIFYDNAAFSAASIAIIGNSQNLILQSVDNNQNGYITATAVYTGGSSDYTIANGEVFELSFTHKPKQDFYALSSIKNLTWVGNAVYKPVAAQQSGLDANLNLYNYGGQWLAVHFKFDTYFQNVSGTPSKGIGISLQKKPKAASEWITHNTYTSDANGHIGISEMIDTTYYDVRLAIVGDTLKAGNVISTADAERINDWVLGRTAMHGFDYYTADVNASNTATITDAYGVFGRISGRFTAWPNGVNDVKFFTQNEYNTIVSDTSINHTSDVTGATNFTYVIGSENSVKFYVLVVGDANSTGYNMARVTPTELNVGNSTITDVTTQYDFSTNSVELSLPDMTVNSDDVIEIPLTVKPGVSNVSSLQLSMMYDKDMLEFKNMEHSEKSFGWVSSINPMDGEISWNGYDPTNTKQYSITSDYNLFKLRFLTKKPQADWQKTPIYATKKFSGDILERDLSIMPTAALMTIMMSSIDGSDNTTFSAYPNPTNSEINFAFNLNKQYNIKVYITDANGKIVKQVMEKMIPAGSYVYQTNIESINNGVYFATLRTDKKTKTQKIIKN
jgi:hypothetical protein